MSEKLTFPDHNFCLPNIERPHIITSWLDGGLRSWQETGASVNYVTDHAGLKIPYIEAGSRQSHHKILLIAGFHLEEYSGSFMALNPKYFLPWLKQDCSFVIVPVVNHYGLNYSESAPEKLLRYNALGVNYNDAWGDQHAQPKPIEIALTETLIRNMHAQKRFDLAISLHEDSELPGIGYFYTVGLNELFRSAFLYHFEMGRHQKADLNPNNFPTNGCIESGRIVVDEDDQGSFENWAHYHLNIPTLLVEGPFGLNLGNRARFLSDALKSSLLVLKNLDNIVYQQVNPASLG